MEKSPKVLHSSIDTKKSINYQKTEVDFDHDEKTIFSDRHGDLDK
jgi:hypothetical protein